MDAIARGRNAWSLPRCVLIFSIFAAAAISQPTSAPVLRPKRTLQSAGKADVATTLQPLNSDAAKTAAPTTLQSAASDAAITADPTTLQPVADETAKTTHQTTLQPAATKVMKTTYPTTTGKATPASAQPALKTQDATTTAYNTRQRQQLKTTDATTTAKPTHTPPSPCVTFSQPAPTSVQTTMQSPCATFTPRSRAENVTKAPTSVKTTMQSPCATFTPQSGAEKVTKSTTAPTQSAKTTPQPQSPCATFTPKPERDKATGSTTKPSPPWAHSKKVRPGSAGAQEKAAPASPCATMTPPLSATPAAKVLAPGLEEQRKVWEEIQRLKATAPDAFPQARLPNAVPGTLPSVFRPQHPAPAQVLPDKPHATNLFALDVSVGLLVAAVCCCKGLDHWTKGRLQSRRFRPSEGPLSGRGWSLVADSDRSSTPYE